MASHTRGIGLFTAENLTGILRAIPHSDGTYTDVCRRAEPRGVSLSRHTLSRWVNNGRADLRAKRTDTSYARFAQIYDERIQRFCNPAANRLKEWEQAMADLQAECDCGNERAQRPDGTLDEECHECLETGRRRR